MCGEDRLSVGVWVDIRCSDTAVTFDLWPFTRLLFINTTNIFNWIGFFSILVCLFSLFITWLFRDWVLFSFILYSKSNRFGLPHCKSKYYSYTVQQWLSLCLFLKQACVWMTYTLWENDTFIWFKLQGTTCGRATMRLYFLYYLWYAERLNKFSRSLLCSV